MGPAQVLVAGTKIVWAYNVIMCLVVVVSPAT